MKHHLLAALALSALAAADAVGFTYYFGSR